MGVLHKYIAVSLYVQSYTNWYLVFPIEPDMYLFLLIYNVKWIGT